MSLKDLTQQQIDETSMLEMAYVVLEDQQQTYDFNDLFHQIADLKKYSKARKEEAIAQFYTDMNLDGRFTTTGTNQWGLRKWYPIEQMEEDIANLPKVRKKKKKKKKKKPSKLLEDELGLSEEDGDEEGEGTEELDLTDEELDLEDDDYDGDYDEDDLDDEEEEMVSEDTSFIGEDDDKEDEEK